MGECHGNPGVTTNFLSDDEQRQAALVSVGVAGAGVGLLACEASVICGAAAATVALGGEGVGIRAPQATSSLANEIQAIGPPRSVQTVVLIETKQGVTVVAGGGVDLTPAQKALANERGLLVADDFPDAHAEITALSTISNRGLLPTRGVTTNKVCNNCDSQMTDLTKGSNFEYKLGPDKKVFEFIERL